MCASYRGTGSGMCSITITRRPFGRRLLSLRLDQKLQPYERNLEDYTSSRHALRALSKAAQDQSLTGTWKKNKELSDSMDEAFAAVQLPWIYRKAVGFLNYLQIEDNKECFKTILKAGGIMDVVEEYPWSGVTVEHKRRDKRQGIHTGRVSRTDEGPRLELEWGDPYSGKGTDTFVLSNGGRRLTQVSTMQFQDQSKNCTYRTIFSRSHKNQTEAG